MRYRVTLTNPILGSLILKKEPKGLTKIQPNIQRGENHGLVTLIDVQLEFYCGAGKEFIDQVRNEQGIDAEIKIFITSACGCEPGNDAPDYTIDYSDDYGSMEQSDCVYEDFYEGRLDLKTWNSKPDFTYVEIDPAGLLQTVKNRLETKVDLFGLETLEGTALTPFSYGPYDLNLHSKKLIKTGLLNFVDEDTDGWVLEGSNTDDVTMSFSLSEDTRTMNHSFSQTIIPEVEEIGEVIVYSGLASSLSRSDTFPADSLQIQSDNLYDVAVLLPSTFVVSGKIKFGVKIDVTLTFSGEGSGVTKTFNTILVPKLYIQAGGTIVLVETKPALNTTTSMPTSANVVGITTTVVPLTEYTFDFSESIPNINDNDPIRVYLKFDSTRIIERPDFNEGAYHIDINQYSYFNYNYSDAELSYIKVEEESTTPATTAKAFAIFETGAQISRVITGQLDSFRSTYFGRKNSEPYAYSSNGCGSFRSFLNGFMVRGFPITGDNKRTIRMSMNDLFRGVNPIDNLGLTVEKIDGQYYVVMEKKRYFYDKNTVMLRISNIPELKRSEAPEYYYNRINTGFDKWGTEFSNGLDEFNSKRQFDTLIKAVDNQLDIISTLDASGYRLEITRRKQYSDSFTEDSQYDEDNFIVCLNRSVDGSNVPTMLDVAEKDENFPTINNLISPETSYNLDISPMRNFIRWSPVINAGLLKSEGREIKFTSGEGNYKMEGQQDGHCPGNWNNQLLSEGQNIQWDSLNNTDSTPIWEPEILEFEYPVTFTQYKVIEDNPKGVFEISETETGYIKAFILDFKYVPDGVSQFKLLRAHE